MSFARRTCAFTIDVEIELAKEKAEKEKVITDVATTVMGAGLGGALIPARLGALLVEAPALPWAWKRATTSSILKLNR